ncbi:MAG TPA: glycosyltransferase [Pyrinomonadaceae bacterium]|jgi:glycosyltransferase involved in cell wall biosynthesis|nr:glycosyltransferase [Pyrinomonadaceae bacterium]
MSGRDIVMIVSGFPRRSETFALGELLALEERGALNSIFATKPGDTTTAQPGSERLLLERVRVLPQGSPAQQADFIVNSLKGQKVSGVHGYFAHTPALVAALTASRLEVPYGFSVHARDARKVAPNELAARAQGAACVVACNTDVAQDILQSGAPVHLLPHGVDLRRFRPQPSSVKGPLRLLAVGRLVEKKGFHVLLEAVARLKSPFRLRIIGEGPERSRLNGIIAAHALSDRVTLEGGMTHADLPEAYRQSQIVVVPSVRDRSGDRDGLPNVILEALACGRPVVASRISAIGSVITHGETGLLVPPGNRLALAEALERLAARPEQRERLGHNGRERVEREYEVGHCTERLYHLMRNVYA